MAPAFGMPNYNFVSHEGNDKELEDQFQIGVNGTNTTDVSLTYMAFYYGSFLLSLLVLWAIVFSCLRILGCRQKTRDPQQRRMYMGGRARSASLPHSPPTIYVSPSNMTPPPKYDAMAPPSYEEVVGIHYPQYQTSAVAIQPIAQPIITAVASQSSSSAATASQSQPENDDKPTGGGECSVANNSAGARRTSVNEASR